MSLVDKATALYFHPESIGSDGGAHCGICWKFDPDGACIEVAGTINGDNGVCGLYVNGKPSGEILERAGHGPVKVSKEEAGYTEEGPSHCVGCEYMMVPKLFGESRCGKVSGMIEGRGCCDLWDPR